MFFLTQNCLPPLLASSTTRLIILTGGKNNHKIKIAVASWQSAVSIHPFDCKYTFYYFRNADHVNCLCGKGGGGGGGGWEKVGPLVKWASRY